MLRWYDPCFKNKSEGFKISETRLPGTFDADSVLHWAELEARQITESVQATTVLEEQDFDFVSFGTDYAQAEKPDKAKRYQAVKRNARFAMLEATTRLKPDLYEEVVGVYDPSRQDVFFDHNSLKRQSQDALGRSKNPEIVERIIAEDMETSLVLELLKSGQAEENEVLTVSRCGKTDGEGFVHEIEKGMLRHWWFENKDGKTLVHMQTASFDGRLLDDFQAAAFLRQEKDFTGQAVSATEMLRQVIVKPKGHYGSALGAIQTLDRFLGPTVAFGMQTESAWQQADYLDYLADMDELKKQATKQSNRVAGEIIKLAAKETNFEKRNEAFRLEIASIIDEIAKQNPDIGEAAFGAKIGNKYRFYQHLISQGQDASDVAWELLDNAMKQTGFCGISCGLQQVSAHQVHFAQSKGIDLNGNKEVLAQNDGVCTNCGKNEGYLIVIDNDTQSLSYVCMNRQCGEVSESKSLATVT